MKREYYVELRLEGMEYLPKQKLAAEDDVNANSEAKRIAESNPKCVSYSVSYKRDDGMFIYI